jgi:hypothetical protein
MAMPQRMARAGVSQGASYVSDPTQTRPAVPGEAPESRYGSSS